MQVALIGYGKMGKTIEQVLRERGHDIILIVDQDNTEALGTPLFRQANVAIEFSNPSSAVENMYRCFDAGVPVVCGTTGWLQQQDTVEQTCLKKNGTLIHATNFSLGVNLFFALNQYLAGLMKDYPEYEVGIREIHHTAKLDAPSGTAITLAEQLLAVLPGKQRWVGQASRKASDIFIESIREDPAPGTHSITYASDIDDIEIKHTAHNRSGFAKGAVLAAEFIAGKKGIYTMREVLGI